MLAQLNRVIARWLGDGKITVTNPRRMSLFSSKDWSPAIGRDGGESELLCVLAIDTGPMAQV